MEDIIKFSENLNRLIEENKTLREKLERAEEWFKLAICVNGNVELRKKDTLDEETYKTFLENTEIIISNGRAELINKTNSNLNGYYGEIYSILTIEDIRKIFNFFSTTKKCRGSSFY